MSRDIKQLVSQMTIEEKAGLCSGKDNWHLKGVARLGIPELMVCDGPHGLRKQDETIDQTHINDSIPAVCFPTACATSCCYNPELLEEMGKAIGGEVVHEKVGIILGPACNIKRSPLCGRNFEYVSEDPLVSTVMTGALIKGIQSQHCGACIKHFACNNQEEKRLVTTAQIDERALREIYLASFEGAIKDAKPWTVMCSYGRINGVFSAENPLILDQILRKEWGFEGFVMSDWGAVNNRVEGCKAGLELQMPGPTPWHDASIVKAVKEGVLDEKILDQCAERVTNIILRCVDGQGEGDFDLEKHHELARKVAGESIVLLKNENEVLPLRKEQKVAFIGHYAKVPRFQGGGSSHVTPFKVTNAYDSALQLGASIEFAQGFVEDSNDKAKEDQLIKEACELAKKSEVAVIFAGLPDSFESEGYDRKHLNMPDNQNRLISEVAKVQSKTVVVLHNGSPILMPWLNQVQSVVEAYLTGQASGVAVVDIIYGLVNPSGHLSETFPLRLEDNPSYIDFGGHMDRVSYMESIFVGYRYYDQKNIPVLFPFGHGLSYTTFKFDNLRVSKENFKDDETVTVSVDVTNTGKYEGKAVVQLYIADKTGYELRPPKELKAFGKVNLKPGEKQTVNMQLNKRSFAFWNVDIHDWYVATGNYDILIGNSSRDIVLTKTVHVTTTTKSYLKVHENTLFKDLYNNPVTKPLILEMLDKYPEQKQMVLGDAPEVEFFRNCVIAAPLRTLNTYFPFGYEYVLELIDRANKLLEAANK